VTLFTYQGVPVRLHNTFFIIAILYIISGAFSAGFAGGIVSAILVVMLFGSVLLHEMGHVAVAQHFGIGTRSITLHLLGGLASIEKEPEDPVEEICIALAGPAVNIVLLFASMPFLYMQVPGSFEFAFINLIMGVFNLVPAYPMDGGRVLRALLSIKLGRLKATEISLIIASIFASIFVIIGIYQGWIGLALVGGFLLFITYAQKKQANF
tara:strand:- start:725 stop:1354 length:630 start_codon:yes stop_codon:yes gene_type:complete